MAPNEPNNCAGARPAATMRDCLECGKPVQQTGKGRERLFCCEAHKQAHANRRAVRGKAVMTLLQAWRVDRGSTAVAKAAFREVCEMVDTFNAEDFEARRPRATEHAKSLLAQGSFIDRRAMTLTCTAGHQGCHGKHRAPFAARGLNDARRAARADGWDTAPGREACPNCRDDNALVAAAR
jgi:endogenous inhibitor of DNA gyrase (YacG/DUF329 family)